ncbi:unnamed protein product [Rotaria sp. Silwood1]|nr:unnamed protein product [Rotaria sp. Silwood1]
MQKVTPNRAEDYDLVCPITLRVFQDPVIAADGRTYEREAIVRWITENGTSPFTRQPLNIEDLRSNYHMRGMAGQRSSLRSSYSIFDESIIYRSSPVAPVNSEVSIIKTGNDHELNEDRCFRRRFSILIMGFLLIALLICGPIVGHLMRNPSSKTKSKYSSSLTVKSPTYCRITCTEGRFYYFSLTVSVVKSGKYHFTSKSHIDTYGYIYNNSFNSSNPGLNLITENNDSGEKKQFKLKAHLQAWETYVLVITTYTPNVRGAFSIVASGPTSVNFSSTTSRWATTKTTKTKTTRSTSENSNYSTALV